jgi:hypothetical protein
MGSERSALTPFRRINFTYWKYKVYLLRNIKTWGAEITHICRKICKNGPLMQKYAFNGKIFTNMQNKNSLNWFHVPQNMFNLLIQDVLVNREKYANAYNSQP